MTKRSDARHLANMAARGRGELSTERAKFYSKSEGATATLRESKAIAASETYPAFVAARFSLLLSILSFILSAAAIAVAVAK